MQEVTGSSPVPPTIYKSKRHNGLGELAILDTQNATSCGGRSVGLVQRVIDGAGIPTVSISQVRAISERLRPPRVLFLRWPFGHALGEPGSALQQRRVVWESGLARSAGKYAISRVALAPRDLPAGRLPVPRLALVKK